MLSPHELSTLLLVQRSPYQVAVQRLDFVTLQRQALVEIERRESGARIARLTQRGSELLRKLGGGTVDGTI
ncbi:hypothetical protein [Burkholderia ubonensis]|uniref:Uncharacterized protein n=1 Tax=Burkholderia ubonensis subsp. mesacidophila TaxID=265293 RepID=A0A2A4FGH1_9BURK|nr:hypothetical protein [Burkholderia ubonensis]PCE32501.1 hypothetical protein BZL54_09775 [Burkholderia ubonensis subsp. mesacidophila]